MSWADLTVSHCITCGCEYAIPTTLWNRQRQVGGFHTCPNGHSQGWGKQSENEKLKRERDRLAQQIAQRDDALKDKDREIAAQKAQVTKLKKRVGAGNCPCCRRHFSNVAAHMATMHPDIANPNVVSLHKSLKAKRS